MRIITVAAVGTAILLSSPAWPQSTCTDTMKDRECFEAGLTRIGEALGKLETERLRLDDVINTFDATYNATKSSITMVKGQPLEGHSQIWFAKCLHGRPVSGTCIANAGASPIPLHSFGLGGEPKSTEGGWDIDYNAQPPVGFACTWTEAMPQATVYAVCVDNAKWE